MHMKNMFHIFTVYNSLIFMPLPTDRCVSGIMFSGCLFVRPSIWACVPLARYLTNQSTGFHQTLADDVVEGKDELVRF